MRALLLWLLLSAAVLGQAPPYANTGDQPVPDGPVIPEVSGLSQAQAEARLRQARVPRWSVVECPAQGEAGRVLFLRPGAGFVCRPDTSVVLWVSTPPTAAPAPLPPPEESRSAEVVPTRSAALPAWVLLLAAQPLVALLWMLVAPRLAREEEEVSRTRPRLWVARA